MEMRPKGNRGEQEQKSLMARLRRRLKEVLAPGLAEDPAEHAEQVARIAGVLYEAFEAVGLRCTLVGGSAIEVHAPGVLRSGDIDLVIETIEGVRSDPRVQHVFSSLGFQRRGRLWVLDDLVVDTPSSHLSDPDELVRVGVLVFRVVKKEVLLRDRVVGFKHWKEASYGQQAVYMLGVFGDDLDVEWLRPQLESEAAWDAFVELRKLAASDEPVTAEVLQALLERLHGKRRT